MIVSIDGLVAMTVAFQATNSGSNPGQCIIAEITKWSKVQGLESCLIGVRGFKSHSPHSIFFKNNRVD